MIISGRNELLGGGLCSHSAFLVLSCLSRLVLPQALTEAKDGSSLAMRMFRGGIRNYKTYLMLNYRLFDTQPGDLVCCAYLRVCVVIPQLLSHTL